MGRVFLEWIGKIKGAIPYSLLFGWLRGFVPYFLLFAGLLLLGYGLGLIFLPLFYICLGGGFVIFSRWIDWS